MTLQRAGRGEPALTIGTLIKILGVLDIDFICSSIEGYRALRGLVHEGGIDTLLAKPLPRVRAPRIDQYGIRCAFNVDAVPIAGSTMPY